MGELKDADGAAKEQQGRCESTCSRIEALQDINRTSPPSTEEVVSATASLRSGSPEGLGVQPGSALRKAADVLGFAPSADLKEMFAALSAEFDKLFNTKDAESAVIREMIEDCKTVAASDGAADVEKCTADELSELADSLAENEALSDEAREFIAEASKAIDSSSGDDDDAASHLKVAAAAACFTAVAAVVV
jgi:DNA helicase HerA-like ATPase